MSLYIRDQDVNLLAGKVQQVLCVKTKTEAVRASLKLMLEKIESNKTFDERNSEVFALADAIGVANPNFDMKAFTDELWDNM